MVLLKNEPKACPVHAENNLQLWINPLLRKHIISAQPNRPNDFAYSYTNLGSKFGAYLFLPMRKRIFVFLSMVVNQKQLEPLSPNKMCHMTIKKTGVE